MNFYQKRYSCTHTHYSSFPNEWLIGNRFLLQNNCFFPRGRTHVLRTARYTSTAVPLCLRLCRYREFTAPRRLGPEAFARGSLRLIGTPASLPPGHPATPGRCQGGEGAARPATPPGSLRSPGAREAPPAEPAPAALRSGSGTRATWGARRPPPVPP